jgi:hypothetical protein
MLEDTSLVVFMAGDPQKLGDKSNPIYTYA